MAWMDWIIEGKYLNDKEARRLMRVVTQRANQNHSKTAVRDCFVIELALSTGLRVSEVANLKCGDIFLSEKMSSLIVRNSKFGKSRVVKFNGKLAKAIKQYLPWKESVGEPIADDTPLVMSSNTGNHITPRALQKAFRRCAKRADLPDRYSFHSMRHTYACQLYKASGYNLRLVQKQLGHASIKTTQIYADVMNPDLEKALGKLYS